jgi:hypothetical protein
MMQILQMIRTILPNLPVEKCGKEMYPEYYRNALGIEFKISDLQ